MLWFVLWFVGLCVLLDGFSGGGCSGLVACPCSCGPSVLVPRGEVAVGFPGPFPVGVGGALFLCGVRGRDCR